MQFYPMKTALTGDSDSVNLGSNPGPPAKTPSVDKLLKTLMWIEPRLRVCSSVWTSPVEQVNSFTTAVHCVEQHQAISGVNLEGVDKTKLAGVYKGRPTLVDAVKGMALSACRLSPWPNGSAFAAL